MKESFIASLQKSWRKCVIFTFINMILEIAKFVLTSYLNSPFKSEFLLKNGMTMLRKLSQICTSYMTLS